MYGLPFLFLLLQKFLIEKDFGQKVVMAFLVGCLSGFFGGLWLFQGLSATFKGIESLFYQPANGTIVQTVLAPRHFKHSPDTLCVTYAFSDKRGKAYSGEQFDSEDACITSSDFTELRDLLLTDYRQGQALTIYYNPLNPEHSLIHKGIQAGPLWQLCLSPILLLIGFLCFRYCKNCFNFSLFKDIKR